MIYISKGNVPDNVAFFSYHFRMMLLACRPSISKIWDDQMALSKQKPVMLHKQDN